MDQSWFPWLLPAKYARWEPDAGTHTTTFKVREHLQKVGERPELYTVDEDYYRSLSLTMVAEQPYYSAGGNMLFLVQYCGTNDGYFNYDWRQLSMTLPTYRSTSCVNERLRH